MKRPLTRGRPGAGRPDAGGQIGPTFGDLFTPKLVTILREGYGAGDLRADALAGLTVAIVALPLSMAIAIASGTTPDRGLITAIIGGFLVSALGGSRFQIGGPAGAFIVLVAATLERHGLDGLLLAVLLAGLMLVAAGLLRLGTYIKFIPYPVTVGFTAAIAVIILASQVRELLGLALPAAEPAALMPKLAALAGAIGTINPWAVALAALTIAVIIGLRRVRPHWPGMLIAVTLAAVLATLFELPVATIGSRFGDIPRTLSLPALPELSWAKARAVWPDAGAFALLGAIESLLSAVVADGMTGRRHRSNCELVAQGIANVASGLFGGICVTGTIARTATNVRAGSRGPVSGMIHAVVLLAALLVAAPLARYIPLAALAGVLAVVAWTMADSYAFATLLRSSWGDAVALLTTFLLTVFRDLSEGILIGFAVGTILFLDRMARAVTVEHAPLVALDRADAANGDRTRYDAALATDPDVIVLRISGAFFFGAASAVGALLDRIADRPKAIVLDFGAVPFVDSTAAITIEGFARRAERQGARLVLTGTTAPMRRVLWTHGLKVPRVRFERTIDDAVAWVHRANPPSSSGA
ncbi:MAG: SulP family inorganic anion transporter [Alphaproteobacteria bacterium]